MTPLMPARLHISAHCEDGQWVVACLDFDLTSQDDTWGAAMHRLVDQVVSYVEDAQSLDDGAHADQLLSRRAPIAEWRGFDAGGENMLDEDALSAMRELAAFKASGEQSIPLEQVKGNLGL